jgi:thiamine-monophosphate kinase
MRVSELGEFGLIERLRERISQQQPSPRSPSAPPNERHPQLLLRVGDDCAVWSWGGDVHLSTTDTMVQDVHFRLSTTSWQDLGWKAMAVNVSDIAAMAGIPDYALVTLGIPEGLEVEAVDGLYDGLMECTLAYDLLLAGGDIVSAPVFFVSISLNGRPGSAVPFPNNVLLRSAARAGDAVAVTGHLGSSAAGLRALTQGSEGLPGAVRAHRRPVPRIDTARLALDAGVRCGMDISDGLVGDLAKLCAASRVGAEIETGRLPVDDAVRTAFASDCTDLALSGGEDYELLLCAPPEVLDAVRERMDLPLTVVGRITAATGVKVDGRAFERAGGWDHLSR